MGDLLQPLNGYPSFFPGLAVALIMSLVVSDPVARWLRVSRPAAGVLVASLGLIVAATLMPGGRDASSLVGCDVSRVGRLSLAELLAHPEDVLNVLLFVPLGLSVALLPQSRRSLVVAIGAFVLPFAIELTQLVVTPLHRACQTSDIAENLGGLIIGWLVGMVAGLARARWSTGPRRHDVGLPRRNSPP